MHSPPIQNSFNNCFISVPVGSPSIDDVADYFEEGQNITLKCRANLGKPAGKLRWYRKRTGDVKYKPISHGSLDLKTHLLPNDTLYAVSFLNMQLLAEDDAALYRCSAEGDIAGETRNYDVAMSVTCKWFPPYRRVPRPRTGNCRFRPKLLYAPENAASFLRFNMVTFTIAYLSFLIIF